MSQFFLIVVLFYFGRDALVQATTFVVTNKCNQIIWPGVLSRTGVMTSSGFTLANGETQSLEAPEGWNGCFWARTGCMFNELGIGNCTTGDCGSYQVDCIGFGWTPPVTVVEFQLDFAGYDLYEVSLLDGFNVAVTVEPKNEATPCSAIGCTANLTHMCPAELKPATGTGCRSACDAFGKPEYCCTGAFASQNACKPNAYTKMFKSVCPQAYSSKADDVLTSTFTCSAPSYVITFCADSVPVSKNADIESSPTNSESGHANKSSTLAIVLGSVSGFLLLACIVCFLWIRRKKKRNANILIRFQSNERAKGNDLELPYFDFPTIAAATDHFSERNKLGEGGFGPVYKGVLGEDQKIAVKRLAKTSHQGATEFKNEVMLIAKLQHRNLVRLLGCCIEGEERILIYEYMLNKSLDAFIFDKKKAALLDWKTRYQIIMGITHGLLYLHHDSRLRIIHRDLKASNVLLDENMNPKISDFGMARIFGDDETNINTRKVVGTRGYMSPEAMDGNFSMKSDVFSYGVLVLEIISGRKNHGEYVHSPHLNVVAHAWSLWNEGKCSELIAETISQSVIMNEALKCMKIGLLCVQTHAKDRPLMSAVIQMFGSDISVLPQPKKPGFTAGIDPHETDSCPKKQTVNDVTITSLDGR